MKIVAILFLILLALVAYWFTRRDEHAENTIGDIQSIFNLSLTTLFLFVLGAIMAGYVILN